MHFDSLFQRLFPVFQSRAARRGQRWPGQAAGDRRRLTRFESLEDRRVLAVLYVANDAGFTDATNPGHPQTGDTVTWNGGGQFTSPVSGLTFGSNAFDTINAAIAAAGTGDTIEVAPGTYSESVDVTKSVTLLGAQASVDARTGRTGASESIVDGKDLGGGQRSTAFYVTANDVTIDGFTIKNTNSVNKFGAGIVLGAGTSGAHIVSDIFSNNLVGLFLANASTTDQAVVQHDLFENNNQTGAAGGEAIYTDQFVAGGALNDVLIDSNKITGNVNAGIGISPTDTTKPASNITISNNTIDSNGRGIYLFDTLSSTITGNDITNDTVPTDGGTSVGIGIDGDVHGLTITGNNIHNGAGNGIRVINENVNANQNVTINDNSIFGFTSHSVLVDSGGYTGTLDATKNWWGTNDAATINGQISGNVAFSPYLDSGTNSITSGPGFQGDHSHLDVTTLGQQVGTVGPIEAAIQAAPAGGTVTIQAGTYTEGDVVINKNLTLQGNGKVVLQSPNGSGNISPSGTGITINGNPQSVTIANLTIDGFFSSLADYGGRTLNLTDLTLDDINQGSSLVPPPLTLSSVSDVNNLNLTTTTSSSRTVLVSGNNFDRFFDGNDSLVIFNVGQLSAATASGSDTFNVDPLPNTMITIDGGLPTPPATPGDTLNMNLAGTTGAKLMVTQDASGFSGSWTFTNAKPVNFTHIETISPSTVTASGAGQTITVTEGVSTGSQVVATFTDQANLPLTDYSADINWGDGTSSAGTVTFDPTSGVYSISGSHTYAEDGSDQIAVTVHRIGAPDVTLDATATVVEPPLVQLFPPVVAPLGHEGAPLTVTVGYFTHGNNSEPASGFTATIDWGDGTASAGTVSPSGSNYIVGGSHTYQDEGVYTVKATVTDTSGGASLTPSTIASVREALLPDGTEGTANQRFVSEVYNDLLHRPVDANGLAYWSAKLDGGTTRAQIVAGIENSDEYRHDEIDALYVHYLHRHADPSGLSAFNDALKHGATDEQVAAGIAGSDEYLALHGGTNDGFLNALFEDALNRPIDPAAKTAFEQFLDHGMTREQATAIVLGSAEYHNDLVAQVYLDVLDRQVDAGGQSYWAGKLADGQTDEQVLAGIIASDEYFAKTSS
jgi:parallel beta-helix repeat protein